MTRSRRHRKKLAKIEIRISGLGGQGVVLAGQILGKAAVYDGKNVVQTQSYGAEARGSMAKSEVIISDDRIGFPIVRNCDILIAMNQKAVDEYLKDMKKGGKLLVDSSNVKEILKVEVQIYSIPATIKAEKLSIGKLCANMVMLGALTAATRIVTDSAMERAIGDTFQPEEITKNVYAYKTGVELVSSTQLSKNVP
jgi:2-oxoglutarate ferredoxin oxidoreductase subunit gamma